MAAAIALNFSSRLIQRLLIERDREAEEAGGANY